MGWKSRRKQLERKHRELMAKLEALPGLRDSHGFKVTLLRDKKTHQICGIAGFNPEACDFSALMKSFPKRAR